MSGFTLYHYWRSSASWRVRWGLEIKRIQYHQVTVDLLAGQEKNEEYRKRNPAAYVPCLVRGDMQLGESLAILEWLEENFPSPSFFHGDSVMRAKIRQLAETVNSGIQPLQNLDIMKMHSPAKEEQERWAKHWNERGLSVYEEMLTRLDRGKAKFSVCDHPTLADLCLIPQCYSALRFGVDLSRFPQCKAIYETARETSECKRASPEAFQPA